MPIELKGIDVSAWQGEIAWDKVKKSGVKFAMLRTAAATTLDKSFKKNIEGALAQGIPCGVYLYSYADTVSEALKEAEFLLEAIRPYKIQYPVAYDIEDVTQSRLTTAQRTDLAVAFCGRIAMDQTKYRPAVYSSLSWFNTKLDLKRITAYDKWIAQWDAPQCSFKGPLHIWQHSSKGSVDGIKGDVDLNICYFNYAQPQPPAETKPQPVPPADNAAIIVKPEKVTSFSAGERVLLSGTPIYSTATTLTPAGSFTGQYWIYDGISISGRVRLTNRQSLVLKKPEGVNVTGFADIKLLRKLNGKA